MQDAPEKEENDTSRHLTSFLISTTTSLYSVPFLPFVDRWILGIP